MIQEFQQFQNNTPLPALAPTHIHEACGPGARIFAAALCARQTPSLPILWIMQGWQTDRINPDGLACFFDPSQIIIARCTKPIEALWVAEESLRSGGIPLVITELSSAPNLTESRRLQLAARAGNATGLFLIPEKAGSNAAHTRWHCHPVYDDQNYDSTDQRWSLIKNKKGTYGCWQVRHTKGDWRSVAHFKNPEHGQDHETAHRMHLATATGK